MKCKGFTKAGKPCIREAKDYCWQHKPPQTIPLEDTKSVLINFPIPVKTDLILSNTVPKEEIKEEIKPVKNTFKEHYFPLRLIDKGTSNVFLIIYKGQYMALKEIQCDKLFKNEVQILKILSDYPNFNKHIVGMFHHSHKKTTDGYNRLFLEYIEGVSLHKLLKMGPVPEPILAYIIETSLQTLKYIHSKKIVHRDLKLQNIIYGLNSLKIIDFGLATYRGDDIAVVGTPNYMSPELWEYKECKDTKYKDINTFDFLKKIDVYALGITFYILLNRKYPYIVNHKDELKKLVLGSQSVISKSGTRYDTLINKMLIKDYQERPFIEDLNL